MPNNHSNTDVVGPEILACSGGHRTDEHVIVGSGGEECISAGNIWRVNRLDRGHDPIMVTEVRLRTGSARNGHWYPTGRSSTITLSSPNNSGMRTFYVFARSTFNKVTLSSRKH
ncbi:hypothetical protein [Paraburkholderia sediminicola]|uniref:hypothetical protein n=1 Tax=Paraburkholderia sediminicola TaxID=458836 RepID=UPI0038B9DF0E